MMETMKHLIGWCGEQHGLLHLINVFGAFVVTMILYVYKSVIWWIRDNIWRR